MSDSNVTTVRWHGEERRLFVSPPSQPFTAAFAQARQLVGREGLFYFDNRLYHTLKDTEVDLKRAPPAVHASAAAEPWKAQQSPLSMRMPPLQVSRGGLAQPDQPQAWSEVPRTAAPLSMAAEQGQHMAAASPLAERQAERSRQPAAATLGEQLDTATTAADIRVGQVEELSVDNLSLPERDSLDRALSAAKVANGLSAGSTVTLPMPRGNPRVGGSVTLGPCTAAVEAKDDGAKADISVSGPGGLRASVGVSSTADHYESRVEYGVATGKDSRVDFHGGIRQPSWGAVREQFTIHGSVIENILSGLNAATGAEVFIGMTVESAPNAAPADVVFEWPVVNASLTMGGSTLLRVSTTVGTSVSGGRKVTYEISFKARDAYALAKASAAVSSLLQRLPAPVLAGARDAIQTAIPSLSQGGRQVAQLLQSQLAIGAAAGTAAVGILASPALAQSNEHALSQQQQLALTRQ